MPYDFAPLAVRRLPPFPVAPSDPVPTTPRGRLFLMLNQIANSRVRGLWPIERAGLPMALANVRALNRLSAVVLP